MASECSLADDDALLEHDAAEGLAKIGALADGLGHDVARAFERIFYRCDFLLGSD